MTDYLALARDLSGELAGLRHAFHREPELGNREFRTAEKIEAYLRACGIPARRLLDTAVVGRLEGGLPGPCVALRADMDALPLQEATEAPCASQVPGVMYACGHDVHMAAVLGAARLLAGRRETLRGSVAFLFQPDEEGNGGAERMIAAGALQGVDAVFGAHVSPDLPAGHAAVRYGKFYAASDTFRVTVTGRSAHGAEREKGIDALAAAARMVTAALSLPQALAGEKSVVSVGTLHAGTAGNILAGSAEFSGIIRTLGPRARAEMRARFEETMNALAKETGASVQCALRASYPGVVNDDAMTRLAEGAARAVLGDGAVRVIEEPTMTTEDFGYFLQAQPGSFYHIGAGCALPLHNPGFLPDDGAAVTGAALHAAVAEAFLNERGECEKPYSTNPAHVL